jgi:hypothetical protein
MPFFFQDLDFFDLFLMAEHSSMPATYHFSYQIPIKLNHKNYLSCKYLILPHVRGYNLLSFLDGSKTPPPETISTGVDVVASNPAFTTWSRQDQLLLA